jgi:hypothetical protein
MVDDVAGGEMELGYYGRGSGISSCEEKSK